VRRDFDVACYGDEGVHVHVDASPLLGSHSLTALPRLREPETKNEPGSLLAPMPGTVVRVVPGLAVGATVKAGEPLLWLEAMKMEHKVVAPASGTLTALHAEAGLQVEVGALLAVVTEDPAPDAPEAPEAPEAPQAPEASQPPEKAPPVPHATQAPHAQAAHTTQESS
jgi:propionyl-CoA carboxylase alpha chain